MDTLAGWATATSSASCCPRRSSEALARQRVVAVSAGFAHSLAFTADGALLSWGDGGHGRLGHGDDQAQWQPKKIEALAGQRVVAVSAGAKCLAPPSQGSLRAYLGGSRGVPVLVPVRAVPCPVSREGVWL